MNLPASAVAVLAALLCADAHAAMYKCVDASGSTSFQQTPCAKSAESRKISGVAARPGGAASDDAAAGPDTPSSALFGTWCFYEQSAIGNTVSERVTITLNASGSYQWTDIAWKQSGTWTLEDGVLAMSAVGNHRLTKVTSSQLEMTRGSTMRWRKGAC